jgi:hypothetical protein
MAKGSHVYSSLFNAPVVEEIWDIHSPMTRDDMKKYRAFHNLDPATFNYSDATSEMPNDPLWAAIWDEIKTWDINVPTEYAGYCGATGNHVTAIYLAIKKALP